MPAPPSGGGRPASTKASRRQASRCTWPSATGGWATSRWPSNLLQDRKSVRLRRDQAAGPTWASMQQALKHRRAASRKPATASDMRLSVCRRRLPRGGQDTRRRSATIRRCWPSHADKDKGHIERNQDRAQASLEAIKLFELSDVEQGRRRNVSGGVLGYEGPVQVEVAVAGGKIERSASCSTRRSSSTRRSPTRPPRSSPSRASKASTPPAAPRSPPKRSSTPRPRRWPAERSRQSHAYCDRLPRPFSDESPKHGCRHPPESAASADAALRSAIAAGKLLFAIARPGKPGLVRGVAQAGSARPGSARRCGAWCRRSASLLFLWLFFYVCCPYHARPGQSLAAAGSRAVDRGEQDASLVSRSEPADSRLPDGCTVCARRSQPGQPDRQVLSSRRSVDDGTMSHPAG